MYWENLVFDADDPRWWAGSGRPQWGERLPRAEAYETGCVEGGPVLDLCFHGSRSRPPAAAAPPRPARRRHPQAETVERLLGLGARQVDIGQGDVPWVVMGDPEGNPFCVMEHREVYCDTGPIAALPLDSADPARDVELWAWLTGWTGSTGPACRAASPRGRGRCWSCVPSRPKGEGKNRLHLDLRLEPATTPTRSPGASPTAEARRLPPRLGRPPVAVLRRRLRQRVLRAARPRLTGMMRAMRPMLATATDHVPPGDGWVHEVKWDGVRVLVDVTDGVTRMFSRNGNVVTAAWPDLSRAARRPRPPRRRRGHRAQRPRHPRLPRAAAPDARPQGQ